MNLLKNNYILADGRWQGQHGIGRFSSEVLARLQHADILNEGPNPLSIKNLIWQSYLLTRKQHHRVFFSPGFNPVVCSKIPFVFTIHDLIHLHIPGNAKLGKKLFYEMLIKTAAKKASRVLTVSEYSRQDILNWTGLPAEQVVVVGNGISPSFTPKGPRFEPGFPYLLHVGNAKAHKNVSRLVEAFAQANIDKDIRLICTGNLTGPVLAIIRKRGLENRVISHTNLSEAQLCSYYRGALGVTFPSLFEGFGLPILEGMASGVPVLTSDTTALPEVAGDAAILVDPYQVEAIAYGIEKMANDAQLRTRLIELGLERAKGFSWDETARRTQAVLDAAV
jgi:glycosyltransferase involved in cell wall biosynthesis